MPRLVHAVVAYRESHPDQDLAAQRCSTPGLIASALPLAPGDAYARPLASGAEGLLATWFAAPSGRAAASVMVEAAAGLSIARPALASGFGLVGGHTAFLSVAPANCTLGMPRTNAEVWVFVDGSLELDLGGNQRERSVDLTDLVPHTHTGAAAGARVDLFYACRAVDGPSDCIISLESTCDLEVLLPQAAADVSVEEGSGECGSGWPAARGGCVCPLWRCGAACDLADCSGHGVTQGGLCSCLPGWGGPHCAGCAEDAACLAHAGGAVGVQLDDESFDVWPRAGLASFLAPGHGHSNALFHFRDEPGLVLVRPRQGNGTLECDCTRRACSPPVAPPRPVALETFLVPQPELAAPAPGPWLLDAAPAGCTSPDAAAVRASWAAREHLSSGMGRALHGLFDAAPPQAVTAPLMIGVLLAVLLAVLSTWVLGQLRLTRGQRDAAFNSLMGDALLER